MRANIDGDIVAYRVAWTVEDQDSFGIPQWRCDEMLDGILAATNASEYTIYLSGESNFRYNIYPEYKISRKTKPKPKWLNALREHLVVNWGAVVTDGYECDDALGISQDKNGQNTIICSIDKDLLQIPGRHYNFVKKEFYDVNELEGFRSFYRQILTGDSGDDVPGLFNVGPVKSAAALLGAMDEADLANKCFGYCLKRLKRRDLAEKHCQLSGSLLKIKQTEDEGVWKFPFHYVKQTEETTASSTQPTPEAPVQSTELTGSEVNTDGC